MHHLPSAVRLLLVLGVFAASLLAQVKVKRSAVIYHGASSNTSAPAVVDEARVKDATPEWQKIQSEAIDPDSAQGKQLLVKMNTRIKDAVRAVAAEQGRDMVTRSKDLEDAQGHQVADLTEQVVARLKS